MGGSVGPGPRGGTLLRHAHPDSLAHRPPPAVRLEELQVSLAVPGRLAVLTGENGSGVDVVLRDLASEHPGALLLDEPPGTEWSPDDPVDAVDVGWLDALGAAHLASRTLELMSNGERQRVRLAAALATGTPVLLLAEGLGYLDLPGVRTALAALRHRCRQGAAVVLTSSAPQALAAADAVYDVVDSRARLRPSSA